MLPVVLDNVWKYPRSLSGLKNPGEQNTSNIQELATPVSPWSTFFLLSHFLHASVHFFPLDTRRHSPAAEEERKRPFYL